MALTHRGTASVGRRGGACIGTSRLVLAKTKDDVEELAKLVGRLRESIAQPSSSSAVAASTLLARVLPDSVRRQVQAADRLIVLPDGPLHGIPFEVLASDDRGARTHVGEHLQPDEDRVDDRHEPEGLGKEQARQDEVAREAEQLARKEARARPERCANRAASQRSGLFRRAGF